MVKDELPEKLIEEIKGGLSLNNEGENKFFLVDYLKKSAGIVGDNGNFSQAGSTRPWRRSSRNWTSYSTQRNRGS